MVKVKFVGMLVGLLFLMNVLIRDYYVVVARQGNVMEVRHTDHARNHDNNDLMVAAAATAADRATPGMDHKELGGRKMVAMKKNKKKSKVSHGAASSAAAGDHHPIDHHEMDDDDHDMNTASYHKKLRYLKQAVPAARRAKNQKVAAAAAATRGDSDQRLREATRNIAALMHRDYKGMNKPKQKPPINNHLPVH